MHLLPLPLLGQPDTGAGGAADDAVAHRLADDLAGREVDPFTVDGANPDATSPATQHRTCVGRMAAMPISPK